MEYIVSDKYDGKPRKLYKAICEKCTKEFYAPKHKKQKFCSKLCSVSERKLVELNCSNCNKQFSKPPDRLKSKSGYYFCCRTCKDEAQKVGKLTQALLRPSHYGDGRSSYRKIAFNENPAMCNRCGYDEHKEILKVHHKDRNRKNNSSSNLEILCPNCHDLEHFLNNDGIYTGSKKLG